MPAIRLGFSESGNSWVLKRTSAPAERAEWHICAIRHAFVILKNHSG